MISYDLQDKFEIHGDGVSSLYTWQDNRCDTDFIESLPQPDSHLKLATGYGCATIFWFLKNRCYLQQQSTLFVFLIDGPKQNAGSLLTPVSNIVFYALSSGTPGFALHGSSLNHFMIGGNSSTANQIISSKWLSKLPWRAKPRLPHERA